MDTSLLSKGAITEVNERPKPALVRVGARAVSSDGRWHHSLEADYVLEHGLKRWITVAELARTLGLATPSTKKRVRKNLAGLFKELLSRGFLLVREPCGNGQRVERVKIFSPKDETESQAIAVKIDDLRRRKETAEETWARAEGVFQATSQGDSA